MEIKNKKKKAQVADITDILWTVFIFVIIGVGIFIGVSLFYSYVIDVRAEESKIISEKLASSVVENGYLYNEILNDNFDVSDIFERSKISEISLVNNGNFYFILVISNETSEIKKFEAGNNDLLVQCKLPNKNFGVCYNREIYALNKTNASQIFKINIITGSNNKGGKPIV
jgi:hypothetical protein